jgi:glycosyltransferase involved in cell wall biosynthesis
LISISEWNIKYINSHFPKRGPVHYVGNGVNAADFPIEKVKKDGQYVLVEGWNALNPSKDSARIAPRVAGRLKEKGYKILAYSQQKCIDYRKISDVFHVKPRQAKKNDLYRRATILLKASHYDARACAPVEAMTKGTVTARAITYGDDDLVHEKNCLRTPYNESDLYESALRLLEDTKLRNRLKRNCYKHLKSNSWDRWIPEIENILTGKDKE